MTNKRWTSRLVCMILCLLISASLAGCSSRQSGTAKIAEAYIDGFATYYDQGAKYINLGLQLQANYAYGWAGASVSAMRYCVDCLLYMKGEGASLEAVAAGRLQNWDDIAAMNYASPYPYYFEGLVYNAESENDYARSCYEKALMNPAFNAENGQALEVLEIMTVNELKMLKKKLTALEDKIYAVYEPIKTAVPRGQFSYSDAYLRAQAREKLEANAADYRGALRYYEAALAVNPFEGDNFVGCALMNLYLDDIDKTFFYVNEGLFVDPEHVGLEEIAGVLNGGTGLW